MGKAHSNASTGPVFFDLDVEPVMKVLVGRDEAGVKAARRSSAGELRDRPSDDRRPDIDLVDIDRDVACEIAIAAAKAGKRFLREAPAMTVGEREMAQVKAGVKRLASTTGSFRSAGQAPH